MSWAVYANDGLLLVVLLLCAFTDLAYSKIYNMVTLPAVILGLLLSLIVGGWRGLQFSVIGLVMGFGLFFLVFLFGGMGGGDVKLMAAIGAIQGYPFVLWAAFFSALMGGFIAIAVMIYHGRLLRSFSNVSRTVFSFLVPVLKTEPLDPEESLKVPYGFGISLGTFLAWVFDLSGRLA